MSKKLLSIVLALVLSISCCSVVSFADDIKPFEANSLSLLMTDSEGKSIDTAGDFDTGNYFYFKTTLMQVKEFVNKNMISKIFITTLDGDDNDYSDVQYLDGSDWKSASAFLGNGYSAKITKGGDYTIRFRVKFSKNHSYQIHGESIIVGGDTFRTPRKKVAISENSYRYSVYNSEEDITVAAPPSTCKIFVDNKVVGKVDSGSSFKLFNPKKSNPTYGYFDLEKEILYNSTYELKDIYDDVYLKTVNKISVSSLEGASIRVTGQHGIRFQTNIDIKDIKGNDITKYVVRTGAVEVGTLITTEDLLAEYFDYEFDKNDLINLDDDAASKYYDILNPFDSWPTSNGKTLYDRCYSGILNVQKANFSRENYVVGYAVLHYSDEQLLYLDKTGLGVTRSIQSVAERMVASKPYFNSLSKDVQDRLLMYCEAN